MSGIQWMAFFILGAPIALYICMTFVYGYVRATTWNEPDHATPPKEMFLNALLLTILLAVVVWAIIPLGESAYEIATTVRVQMIVRVDGGAWHYVRFEGNVECTGDLLLRTEEAQSQPSPDCDGNPKRDLRFYFRQDVPEGTQIIKIEIRPGGNIRGASGERVDLSIR